MNRAETRQAIRSINASLRIFDARGYTNLHETLLTRAKQMGAIVRYDKNGKPYIGQSNEDIDAMNLNVSRLQGLAQKSKLSYIKEKHRINEKESSSDLDRKIEKSEIVTDWLRKNKYTLYALEEQLTPVKEKSTATAKRSKTILDEMEKGYKLDIDTVYNAIQEMERKDKKDLKESEVLLKRLGKNKPIKVDKL